MIKLIIFDLDGVLVEAKHLHYVALNEALDAYGYKITRLEHLCLYDGHTTKQKMNMLTEKKGLPIEYQEPVWTLKQRITGRLIKQLIREEPHITDLVKRLKQRGYKIALCSNAIRDTCERFLKVTNLYDYFDGIWSNEDVPAPKPSPEGYKNVMKSMGFTTDETIIVEDSPIGLRAAYDSGAHVCPVKNTKNCTWSKVSRKITEVDLNDDINNPDGG